MLFYVFESYRFRVWVRDGDRAWHPWKLHSQFHRFELAAAQCRLLQEFSEIAWCLVDVELPRKEYVVVGLPV